MSEERVKEKKSVKSKTRGKGGKGRLPKFLRAYFSVDKKLSGSALYRSAGKKNRLHSAASELRDEICRAFTESRVKKRVSSFLYDLLYIRTRDIGIYLLASGLYAAIEYFILGYAVSGIEPRRQMLYGAVAMMICSLLFLSSRSLADTIYKNRLFSFIVFDLCGVDKKKLPQGKVRIKNASMALLFGMITGVIAFLVEPQRIILAAFCVIFGCVILCIPETGAVLMLFLVPFLPLSEVLTLAVITAGSYAVKLLRKKRELRLGAADIAFMLLLALTALGKAVTAKSTEGTDTLFITAVCAYFIFRNLFCKRDWLDRAIHAAALSSACVSFFGLISYICGTPAQMSAARSLIAGQGGEMSVILDSSAALASYMLLTSPLLLYFGLYEKRGRALYLMSYAAAFACTVLTERVYAVVALIVVTVFVLIAYSRKSIIYVGVAAVLAVVAVTVLPRELTAPLFEKISGENAAIASVWQGAFRMFGASWFGGSGIGSFNSVYPQFAVPGAADVSGAKSLYLQLLCEGGIMLLISFAVCVVLIFMFGFTAAEKRGDKHTKNGIYAPLSALSALLLYGAAENVFCDEKITLLFFAFCGLAAASSELCRRALAYEAAIISREQEVSL